jgi:hypothetical protein
MEMHKINPEAPNISGLIRFYKPDHHPAPIMNGLMPQPARYRSLLLIPSNYTFQYLTHSTLSIQKIELKI